MTRKAPTGPKHDRCIDHVEHPYPKSGRLCIGSVIGREGMIAFADEIAASAAGYRASFSAQVEARHHAPKMGRKPSPTIQNAPKGAGHISRTASDAAALAELVARYRTMRGEPIEPAADTYAAAVKVAKARKPRPVVTPEPVAEMAPVSPEPETHPYRFDDTIRHPGASRSDCADCYTQDAPAALPAPVLVASQPVQRPTCERCGQSFRKSGAGLAWHVANRPDCAGRLSVVA